jgi:hypothetical protein
MPQHRTKAKDTIYAEILTWIHTEIRSKFPTITILMGGYIQATPNEEDERLVPRNAEPILPGIGIKTYYPERHTYVYPSKNVDRPLATETTNHDDTLYELKHNDHHPHPGIRRPQGPSPQPPANRNHQHS